MSAAPAPLPSSTRPPFGGPPITTTFDPSSDGSGDWVYRILADSVAALLRSIKHADHFEMPIMLRLLGQRKAWIENEMAMERLFSSSSIPPFPELMTAGDYAEGESENVSKYLQLLSAVEDEIVRIRKKLENQTSESDTSEL